MPFTGQSQDPPQYGTPFANVPDPRDVNIYQVHIRPYSAAGNLAGVTARLDAIQALGINVVYLMPIHPVGQDARSSISPYCIKDFRAVATEYGTLADLRTLVDEAHSRGMAVIMDWVVNQTSWDHPWITQHPERYIRDGNGVIQPLNPFPDVAALDLNNTAVRTEMINAMRYWIFTANIDGFRCDYANNPPLNFWTQVIGNLRSISGRQLLLFAEGDRQENFTAGFDFTFGDKWYYDALKPIRNGTSVAQIQTTTDTEYVHANSSQQVIRYTANHDTEGNETPLQVFGGHNGVVVNFLVSAYMRGAPFLTSGQEVDFNRTIPWPYTSVKINWNTNPSAAADFTDILQFRNSSTAIRRGTMTNYSNTNVCAFTKTAGSEKVVVIANLRSGTSTYVIPAALAGAYTNAFDGTDVNLVAGATRSLNGFGYLVLTNANVAPVPVTGVSVAPANASVHAGQTLQLTATIAPSNATNQSVSWSSSNTSVATVNASGLVTAITPGTANITVTTADGQKTAVSAIQATPLTSFTVHFYKPAPWGSNIRIYWWNAQPSGTLADGTWPGVAMQDDGDGWYSHTFVNITSTNLIFNDGGNQTADLNRDENGWYMNGTWYGSQPTNPGTGNYVTIKNRWKGTYLYDAGGNTGYGTSVANNNYKWEKVPVTAQYFLLRNVGTGEYMHIENQTGSVQCTAAGEDWWSAQWSQEQADGVWQRLRNRWQTGHIIHVENQTGSAQYANAQDGWWSAQWQLEATTVSLLLNEQSFVKPGMQPSLTMNIFPNPAINGTFRINLSGFTGEEMFRLTIYDMQGKQVKTEWVNNDTSVGYHLPTGLYIIELKGKATAVRKKLIVQ
ncbi:hypothetical protein CCY01nite_42990 [Chitinophaga cymbidii]|uniref:Glycosyl hydrolase family 13 catalytic domain-containing protein n=1 Tax=Chitinophaga cymbidii TaxID=1096750 RepID=A0A512RQQ7_9BACT|nr:hypothetical protein CCY01nite_42990 [Chitinophaga cymbidii]